MKQLRYLAIAAFVLMFVSSIKLITNLFCVRVNIPIMNKINIEIIIDDYLGREHYNILKNYFEVKKIGRMASLKVKKSKLDEKVFKQYLLDPR